MCALCCDCLLNLKFAIRTRVWSEKLLWKWIYIFFLGKFWNFIKLYKHNPFVIVHKKLCRQNRYALCSEKSPSQKKNTNNSDEIFMMMMMTINCIMRQSKGNYEIHSNVLRFLMMALATHIRILLTHSRLFFPIENAWKNKRTHWNRKKIRSGRISRVTLTLFSTTIFGILRNLCKRSNCLHIDNAYFLPSSSLFSHCAFWQGWKYINANFHFLKSAAAYKRRIQMLHNVHENDDKGRPWEPTKWYTCSMCISVASQLTKKNNNKIILNYETMRGTKGNK